MRTDELIDQLGSRPPVGGMGVPVRLAVAAALGAMAALALVVAWLNIRPDLALAVTTTPFWMKLGYGVALAISGLLAVERLSRPAGAGRRGLLLAIVAFLVLAVLGVVQILTAAPDDRLAIWLGRSWRHCPTNVLVLALPMLAVGLLVVRSLAPTRLMLTGAATGLFSGGVAMVAYCLHCPETEPAFVATWYTLGAMLTAAVGAVLGPLVLRWQ